MERALVIGATGLVGMNLVKTLCMRGIRVTAHIHWKQPGEMWDGVDYRKADLNDPFQCDQLVCGHDVVFLCASSKYSAGLADFRPMERAFETLRMTMNVMESALREKVDKVIFLSSSTVYTGNGKLATERDNIYDDPVQEGRFYYTWLKRMAEKLVEMAFRSPDNRKMSVVILRPTNIYGPYDDFSFRSSYVMPALIRKVADGLLPLTMWGDGTPKRNFLYVEDLVTVMINAAEAVTGFEIFNIGTDNPCTLKELAETILKVSGESCTQLIFDISKPSSEMAVDISFEKAKRVLGFRAGTSLEEGISRTREWYLAHAEIYK